MTDGGAPDATWRAETPRTPIQAPTHGRRGRHPAVVLVAGFCAVILIGAAALTLPLASAEGRWTPLLDALFTATSAVTVTGLVVVDTGTYWSGAGQAIILLLVQLGGLGFMTCSTLLLWMVGRRASLRERLLLGAELGGVGVGSALALARRVVLFTFVVELIGAALLAARVFGEMEAPRAVWWGVFHAVSAFNSAGFDITGGYRSLVPHAHDPVILLTVAGLAILGGISYVVVADVAGRRRFARLTLNSKLVLVVTAALVGLGTVGLLFTERANPHTLGGLEAGPRLLNAFFQAVTPRSAGFNSVDVGALTEGGLLILVVLMFVGGAAGSTAGGIKVQTLGLLVCATASAVRGLPHVEAFRRRVPVAEVLRAVAMALLASGLVLLVAFALNVTERFAFLRDVFEVVSAFGTVGLTTGITPETTPAGRALLILTMFAGRLGPLTLMLALVARQRRATYEWPEESVKIG